MVAPKAGGSLSFTQCIYHCISCIPLSVFSTISYCREVDGRMMAAGQCWVSTRREAIPWQAGPCQARSLQTVGSWRTYSWLSLADGLLRDYIGFQRKLGLFYKKISQFIWKPKYSKKQACCFGKVQLKKQYGGSLNKQPPPPCRKTLRESQNATLRNSLRLSIC